MTDSLTEGTLRVLLIEDDDRFVSIIQRMLELADLETHVTVANSSSEALNILADSEFDCVLADYIIPGISGFDTLKKAEEMGNYSPFIIITSYGDPSLGAVLMENGACDYLPKDQLKLDVLQDRIKRAVHVRKIKVAIDEKKYKPGCIGEHMTSPPVEVGRDETIDKVIDIFNSEKIGSVLVKNNDNGAYTGIITKRDLILRVLGKKLSPEEVMAFSVMTNPIISENRECLGKAAMKTMLDKRIQHLGVTDGEGIVGVVSTKDLILSA
ncbi:hypothetical protein UZ36_05600 [Candidatus Nitromaritima sp. SCGC AAA799-C22]|nr:hypothetical protein UZ36_05600 [Candidatus Nitromaritima sp. SCGC AAA799-C22]